MRAVTDDARGSLLQLYHTRNQEDVWHMSTVL